MRSAIRPALLAALTALPVLLAPVASAQSDNCDANTPVLTGTGDFAFSTVGATFSGQPTPCGGTPGLGADVWWKWSAPYAGTFRFAVCEADYDVVVALRFACGAPVLRCSDRDGCGQTSYHTAEVEFQAAPGLPLVIQLDGWNGEQGTGVLTIEAVIGDTSPCSSVPNSTGQAATLRATGSTSIAENALTLIAEDVPNQPGLFFHGTDEANIPFGNGGTLCVGNIVARSPVVFATGNVAERQISLPMAGIFAPNSHYFQYWFRDATGPDFYNTSDSIKIVFVP